jgi:hypothetical protein
MVEKRASGARIHFRLVALCRLDAADFCSQFCYSDNFVGAMIKLGQEPPRTDSFYLAAFVLPPQFKS